MTREQEGRRGPALRRLDDRIVPLLQRGGRRLGRGLLAPFRLLNRAEERFLGWLFRPLWRRRQLIAFAAALLTFAGAFVHLQRFDPSGPSEVAADEGRDTSLDTSDDAPTTAGTVVGPTIGEDLAAYAQERVEALEDADGDEHRLATVSLVDYATAEEVAAILDETLDIHAVQLRLPGDGEEPFQVELEGEDLEVAVEAALVDERERIADEEGEFQRLLDSETVSDPEFAEFYEAEVERLRTMRNLIDGGSGLVFAVVVEGEIETLRALLAHDDVRLVDLADGDAEREDVAFYGLLPEETGTASYGHFG